MRRLNPRTLVSLDRSASSMTCCSKRKALQPAPTKLLEATAPTSTRQDPYSASCASRLPGTPAPACPVRRASEGPHDAFKRAVATITQQELDGQHLHCWRARAPEFQHAVGPV